MPCYHPMIRVEDLRKPLKAKDGHIYYKATICDPQKAELERVGQAWQSGTFRTTTIPCGQCIGCRLDYSREWANRGFLEAQCHEQNWFVTITYDDDHLHIPEWVEDKDGITYTDNGEWNGTLVPEDLTRFIKNVRQIMKREYDQDGIRFMACGEYGDEGARPHYHIIFFNLNLPIEDVHHPKIQNKNVYYESHIIDRAWGGERYLDKARTVVNPKNYGIANISEASWNNIAYTARYITKKIKGKESDQIYAANGKIKEFFRVSRMPGIGEQYYREHWEEIYERDEIIVKNRTGAISCKPPKYFDELYKKDHPEEFKKIQKKRKERMWHSERVKDSMTSLFRQERLDIEERSKEEKQIQLKREFESKRS